MKNKFSERLTEAMKIRGIKQNKLAQLTGIDKSAISCYCSGKYQAAQKNTYLLSEALHINPAWLMGSDEVPMDSSMTASMYSDSYEYLSEVMVEPTDLETAMIVNYRKADDKTKKVINTLLGLDEQFKEG